MSTVIAASGPYEEDPRPSNPIAGTPSKEPILRSSYSSFASRRPRISLSNDILDPRTSTLQTDWEVGMFQTLDREKPGCREIGYSPMTAVSRKPSCQWLVRSGPGCRVQSFREKSSYRTRTDRP